MKRGNPTRERGAALLALLAVIMLGASWFLVSKLNSESAMAQAAYKARNAEVLNRAKLALVGYVAAQAVKAGENNPGVLPCPEAAGYFDSTTQDGQTASSCSLPKVGRFPWRTIGTEKLVDAAGEPLWYVVSPGWAYTSGNTNINSNSVGQLTVDGVATTPVASPGNVSYTAHGFVDGDSLTFSTGGTLPTGISAGTPYYVIAAGLTANTFRISASSGGSAIDFTGTSSGSHNVHRNPQGAANSVVALIIAPGPAFNVAASTGCSAIGQVRATTGTPDWRNYLECENATFPTPDATFVTTGPSGSFNDQVMKVTVGDIMPGIEAAIANRIEREILPALQTVYTPAAWGFTGAGTTGPVLPFAAPFASPGPGTGTSNYHGASGTYAGLLPFNQMRNCTVSAADPRCTSTVLTYSKASNDVQTAGSGSIYAQSTCVWESTTFVCTGQYTDPNIAVTVSISVANVAGGLRTLDLSKVSCTAVDDAGGGDPVKSVTCSVSAALQSDGSLRITAATSLLPDVSDSGWNTRASYKVNIDEAAFGDHALLSSTDPGTCPSYGCTGWFVRNEWYRLLYYAVSQGNTAAQLPSERSCNTPVNCLTIANMTLPDKTPSISKSVALILAGRSINGSARPSSTLADYLEFGNANGSYEKLLVPPGSAVVYSETGTGNDYVVAAPSVAAGSTFQFKATHTNSGSSNLSTTATGSRSLVNTDGSTLAASAIQANAVIEVSYDGTRFVLRKRPINDRFAVLGSN